MANDIGDRVAGNLNTIVEMLQKRNPGKSVRYNRDIVEVRSYAWGGPLELSYTRSGHFGRNVWTRGKTAAPERTMIKAEGTLE